MVIHRCSESDQSIHIYSYTMNDNTRLTRAMMMMLIMRNDMAEDTGDVDVDADYYYDGQD